MDDPKQQESAAAAAATPPSGSALGRFSLLALALAALWCLLSGRVGTRYFVMMGISVALVARLNADRIYRAGPFSLPRLLRYLGWLLASIVKANLEVARIVLSPRLPIDPALLVFETVLERPGPLVMIAHTITLTPGTVTADLREGRYVIHSLVPSTAADIESGKLQNVVRAVFAEPPEPPPAVRRIHSVKDLPS